MRVVVVVVLLPYASSVWKRSRTSNLVLSLSLVSLSLSLVFPSKKRGKKSKDELFGSEKRFPRIISNRLCDMCWMGVVPSYVTERNRFFEAPRDSVAKRRVVCCRCILISVRLGRPPRVAVRLLACGDGMGQAHTHTQQQLTTTKLNTRAIPQPFHKPSPSLLSFGRNGNRIERQTTNTTSQSSKRHNGRCECLLGWTVTLLCRTPSSCL